MAIISLVALTVGYFLMTFSGHSASTLEITHHFTLDGKY